VATLLAIPAFLPAFFCTGYSFAWFTNLLGFRQRSLVERIFWSIPLSLAITAIASVLIGKALSLNAVVVFLVASALLFLVALSMEWLQLRRAGLKWTIGWHPLGTTAFILAIAWVALAVLSLVDFQFDQKLCISLTLYDQAPRADWIQSILHTGVPPVNPLYLFKHPATMRYYYFWYVVCAAVAHGSHLSARAALMASCVWSGFALAALIGLYLKHFLHAGVRLRKQFLRAVALLLIPGVGLSVVFFSLFKLLPGYIEGKAENQITSWFASLFYVPHHVASMVCCMFAFLLAWMAGRDGERGRIITVVLIAFALASAFGLSIYVEFGFLVVMALWAAWQIVFERSFRPALLLAAGGAGAIVLLLPYLWELTHVSSNLEGGSVFAFAVREMIPPDGLLASHSLQHLAINHPLAALNIAKLILLIPGYGLELGFYFVVLLIYLVPAWRGRTPLDPARRSLVFIAVATLILISLVRSGVLTINDFGLRAALLMQFPLLLLGSEVITAGSLKKQQSVENRNDGASIALTGLPLNIPRWLQWTATLALVFGVIGTTYQALQLRFVLLLDEAVHDQQAAGLSHFAYISSVGYAHLDTSIPYDAVVQFDPVAHQMPFWNIMDLAGVNHQAAIIGDQKGCGSEFGGDPSGCKTMGADIDALYRTATAEQARTVCRQYGIQYLVARPYDPAWNDKSSWVWTLNPVVADQEFRALDCR
jgi:hypothetical protein